MLPNAFPFLTQCRQAIIAALPLVLLFTYTAASGQNKPILPNAPGLKIGTSGYIDIDSIKLQAGHLTPDWKWTAQPRLQTDSGYPRRNPQSGNWEVLGNLKVPNAEKPLRFTQEIIPLNGDSAEVLYQVTHSEGVPTNELVLRITLPVGEFSDRTVRVDNTNYTLPEAFAKQVLFNAPAGVHSIVVPTKNGALRIEGDFSLLAQDERKWQGNTYSIRLRFAPVEAQLKDASLKLKLTYLSAEGLPDKVTIRPDTDWAPLPFSLDIEPGSIFDFSQNADAPAGKYGQLIVTPEGHFAFADRPEQPVRFWGVNITSWAVYISREEIDQVVERLVRSGYNTVRLHHFDNLLNKRGGYSYEFDSERLDQLNYFFSVLKANGLYINIDLYSSRTFHPDELTSFGLAPIRTGSVNYEFKSLMPISDGAFDSWKRFAENLLTQVNPYTGMTWAEDPALIGICLINEDSPYARVHQSKLLPLYQQAFDNWLKQPQNSNRLPGNASAAQRETLFNEFIFAQTVQADARMMDFLRSLDTKALLTNSNHRNAQGLTLAREHYDYVDNHQYWDHPLFPLGGWQLPQTHHQMSVVKGDPDAPQTDAEGFDRPASGALFMPRMMMPTRVFGLPFAVTEFQYVRPNQYRAEGHIAMSAYAGLQNWDAIYNYEYAARSQKDIMASGGRFSLAIDPINLLGDRLAAVSFLRYDVQPSSQKIVYAVDPEAVYDNRLLEFPGSFSRLGLIAAIGSLAGSAESVLKKSGANAVVVGSESQIPANTDLPIYVAGNNLLSDLISTNLLPKGSSNAVASYYLSDTNEILANTTDGSLLVTTPRLEQFILPPLTTLKGQSVSVTNGETFSTISVLSADGNPIRESERLLLLHLTNAIHEGSVFSDPTQRRLENWGDNPILINQGKVRIRLQLNPDLEYTAWAVHTTGKRLHTVNLKRVTGEAGVWEMTVETIGNESVRLAYELVANGYCQGSF